MGEKEGEVDPAGSFQEAVENAKDKLEAAKPEPVAKNPDDTQELAVAYSALKGALKTVEPVIAGALTVGFIAVLDYVLNTDYLSGKLSPIAVIGVTAAARFVQNYLKQANKAKSQKE